MELHIATLDGDLTLQDVPNTFTGDELRNMIWKCYKDKFPNFPAAAEQQLVFNDERINDTQTLSNYGVKDGSTLVLFRKRHPRAKRPRQTEPKPTLEEVEAVVAAEAGRKGRVLERAPSADSLGRGRSVEQQLQQLMRALQGIGQGGGGQDILQQIGLRDALGVLGSTDVDESDEEPSAGVVAPPPDESHVTHLQEMGFPEGAVRRALLLNRNQLNPSINWLLSHADDATYEAPPTEDELRSVYARVRTPRTFVLWQAYGAPHGAAAPDEDTLQFPGLWGMGPGV